jgi:glycosyltransferase involved in cell wall biosynthesis
VTQNNASIAVIVPVRNRRELLGELLDALSAQTYRDFEVVVVDNGSTDGSAEVAEQAGGLQIRVIRTPGLGAFGGRRLGVAESDSAYLAFTDSDCRPEPGWLAAGVAALEAGADVVNGATRPAGPVGMLDHSVASGEEGLYPTCNVFYRRAAFEAAGGFDPDAGDRLRLRIGRDVKGLGFGEDTLLAWEVRRRGSAAFAPEAVVEHAVFHVGLVEMLNRTLMIAAFPSLVRAVPELRRTKLIRARVSLGRRSRLPVYLAAGALAARRPRVAALAGAWWVFSAATELRDAPGPWTARLSGLPVVLARDVVSAACLVAGSIRARSPVI